MYFLKTVKLHVFEIVQDAQCMAVNSITVYALLCSHQKEKQMQL